MSIKPGPPPSDQVIDLDSVLTRDEIKQIMVGVLMLNEHADREEMLRVVKWATRVRGESMLLDRILAGELYADWPEGAHEPRLDTA